MIDSWFSKRCMTLVGDNGRALTGEALAHAEQTLTSIKMTGAKVWADRLGLVFFKERALFSPIRPLLDKSGKQLRICGKMVSRKAKFCSKCGNSAPGSWWRCGGCGKMIATESKSCPHCAREQNPAMRLDITDGTWQKDDDVFAERFELFDILPRMTKGLNVQENHCALLLDGGAVSETLAPGFYANTAFDSAESETAGDKSIVMVDKAEFNLPVCVEDIKTKDDLSADLHVVIVLRFAPEKAGNFMCNLMGNSLFLKAETLTSTIGYDAIAHCLLADIDGAAREFCNSRTIEEIFKDARTRLALEDSISERIKRNLDAIGMSFIRLKEIDFSSEVFDKLRETAGSVEVKRREIEFMLRADELANDATRREAMSEYEMEDFMLQLAHEKGIKDDLRAQEIERMRLTWTRQKDKDALSHEHDLDDIQQERQLERNRIDAQYEQEMLDLRSSRELQRRLAEQEALLAATGVEDKIKDIKRAIEIKDTEAKQESTRKWLEIQQQKAAFSQSQKIELLKAVSGADIQSLLMIEDDLEKRKQLLALHEQQTQAQMSPELLLAAAAARGNAAAVEAMSRLNKVQIDMLERAKQENKDMFESFLRMNEREFNQATEKLAQNDGKGSAGVTTQIIK